MLSWLKRQWFKNKEKKKQEKTNPVSHIKDWYDLVPVLQEPGSLCVRIIKGPYENLVIKFGAVNIVDTGDTKEKSTIRYEYDFVVIPQELSGKELSEEEETVFHNFLGDVLSDLLYNAFQGESKEVIAEMIEQSELRTEKGSKNE